VRYAGGHDPGPRLVKESPGDQESLQNAKQLETDQERRERQGRPSPLPEPLRGTLPAAGPWGH
jgi:hypothetical protein